MKAECDTCDNFKGFCYLQNNLDVSREEVICFFPTGILLKQSKYLGRERASLTLC